MTKTKGQARRERKPQDPPEFKFKKYLGQHFLADRNISERMIDACGLDKSETVLEIGPGLGVLTRLIAPCVSKVIAVEKDKDLCRKLGAEFQNRNVQIIHADFLRYDLAPLPGHLKAVGNLPYYISTPIIARILKSSDHFDSLFITVQLEFANRMIAVPGTKDYSAFSCFVQYHASPKMLFKIAKTCFKPAPKVTSCFMRLDIRRAPPYPVSDLAFFWSVIHSAFQQRRKTLPNALSAIIEKENIRPVLEELKIDPRHRAENLSLKDFADIANAIAAKHPQIETGEG